MRRLELAAQEALDKDRLSKELLDIEQRYAGILDRAPIGLAMLDPQGSLLSANSMSAILCLPSKKPGYIVLPFHAV